MNDDDRNSFLGALGAAAADVGTEPTPAQAQTCLRYAEMLIAFNQHTNLTRIVVPVEIAVKHFGDSFSVLRIVGDTSDSATIADIGTGAGFPGLALKIVRPDLRLTLIDSLAKRIAFLRSVIDELALGPDIVLVHARAEDAGRLGAHRDRYDFVTARAVAPLPTLLEWCGPLVRPGGKFIAMKSGSVGEERDSASVAAQTLGLRLEDDLELSLPAIGGCESVARRLLGYRKMQRTPEYYPRRGAEIKARPLGS